MMGVHICKKKKKKSSTDDDLVPEIFYIFNILNIREENYYCSKSNFNREVHVNLASEL